jgi:translation initiation factor eIF-2B subunit epsilon
MRRLQLIKFDFILLSGDVVSNLNLMEAVEAHRERRKVSKDAIMTMVVKEGGLGRKIRWASLLTLCTNN